VATTEDKAGSNAVKLSQIPLVLILLITFGRKVFGKFQFIECFVTTSFRDIIGRIFYNIESPLEKKKTTLKQKKPTAYLITLKPILGLIGTYVKAIKINIYKLINRHFLSFGRKFWPKMV
jgi:hypothetical protein